MEGTEYIIENCKIVKYPNMNPIVYDEYGSYMGDLIA